MVLVTHGTQDNSSEEAAVIKSIDHKSNSLIQNYWFNSMNTSCRSNSTDKYSEGISSGVGWKFVSYWW